MPVGRSLPSPLNAIQAKAPAQFQIAVAGDETTDFRSFALLLIPSCMRTLPHSIVRDQHYRRFNKCSNAMPA